MLKNSKCVLWGADYITTIDYAVRCRTSEQRRCFPDGDYILIRRQCWNNNMYMALKYKSTELVQMVQDKKSERCTPTMINSMHSTDFDTTDLVEEGKKANDWEIWRANYYGEEIGWDSIVELTPRVVINDLLCSNLLLCAATALAYQLCSEASISINKMWLIRRRVWLADQYILVHWGKGMRKAVFMHDKYIISAVDAPLGRMITKGIGEGDWQVWRCEYEVGDSNG